MKTRLAFVWCSLFCVQLLAQSSVEPQLLSAQFPSYPALARTARIAGEVKASVVLDPKGNVLRVEVAPGANNILSTTTRENIMTWKFSMPDGPADGEWRYETTFRYRFSDKAVRPPDQPKLVVTVNTFHDIEIVTEKNEVMING
jgi:TonB family protein